MGTVVVMLHRPTRPRAAAVAAALALVLALSACSSSPTSTYRTDTGQEVTVDWADYPGHAGMETDAVLRSPSAEEVEEFSALVLGDIEQRLTTEFGVEWADGPDGEGDRFHPFEGNGYGGASSYVTFNSTTRETRGIPTEAGDWDGILEIARAALSDHGFGALEAEHVEPAASDDLDRTWQWSGSAQLDAQWVFVTLIDVDRDPSGDARGQMEGAIEYGWEARSISIAYGATTISEASREEFTAAAEPFEGLERPEATSSD